eukprot:875641-Prymnesium_polylepis.1
MNAAWSNDARSGSVMSSASRLRTAEPGCIGGGGDGGGCGGAGGAGGGRGGEGGKGGAGGEGGAGGGDGGGGDGGGEGGGGGERGGNGGGSGGEAAQYTPAEGEFTQLFETNSNQPESPIGESAWLVLNHTPPGTCTLSPMYHIPSLAKKRFFPLAPLR